MNKKFCILLEDDFEISGNGLGNVAELQYLPAISTMNIAEKYGIKWTFMVDVVQQLLFNKYQHQDKNLRPQKLLWDETILQMKNRGFDVQLHIHPQWHNSIFKNGFYHVTDKWNIGSYTEDLQKKLIMDSIEYLDALIKPGFPDHKIIGFKAGGWGIQPSETFLSECIKAGIKIIIAVRKGLQIPNANINFNDLEENFLPYHPYIPDITKINKNKNELIVIPLQPFSPNLITLSQLAIYYFKTKLTYSDNLNYYYSSSIPKEIKSLNPLKDKSKINFSLKPYTTHLKIGNQPFDYLKASFDSVIKNLRHYANERILIIIESHTKQFPGHYKEIEKFLSYLCRKYEKEVEFSDLTSFLKEIEKKPEIVRVSN